MISNIRTEIVGVTQIQSYCKKNRILTDDQSSLPYNINFVQKQKKKHGTNPVHPINFDDFNFRVSYNTEKTISHHSGIIKSIISKWSDSRKIFRLLSRVLLFTTTSHSRLIAVLLSLRVKSITNLFLHLL